MSIVICNDPKWCKLFDNVGPTIDFVFPYILLFIKAYVISTETGILLSKTWTPINLQVSWNVDSSGWQFNRIFRPPNRPPKYGRRPKNERLRVRPWFRRPKNPIELPPRTGFQIHQYRKSLPSLSLGVNPAVSLFRPSLPSLAIVVLGRKESFVGTSNHTRKRLKQRFSSTISTLACEKWEWQNQATMMQQAARV